MFLGRASIYLHSLIHFKLDQVHMELKETTIENAVCKKKCAAGEAEAKFVKQCSKHELLCRRETKIVAANEVKGKHVLGKTLEKVDQICKKCS